MSRAVFIVEYHTDEGRQRSRPFTTALMARKWCDWYAAQSWCLTARVMRQCDGGYLAWPIAS